MAVAFEKHIPLSLGTSPGLFTRSTTSGTYEEISVPTYASVDPADYTSPTFYYEVSMKVAGGTGSAQLHTKAGSAVSGAEVTTTSTSTVRVRSSSFSLSSGEYTDRIKNSAVNATTFYGGKIIVEQSAAAIVATETQIPNYYYDASGTSSGSYADAGTIGNCYFLYTSANWDGTVTVYFEATFKTSAATGYVTLTDLSNNAVASAEITTTSTSYTRVRSSAITLSNATSYKTRIKNDGSNTTTLASSRVVVKQTASPTKSESYNPIMVVYGAGGGFADSNGRTYYDSTKWTVDTISWYAEYTRNSNTGSGVLEMYALTSGARVTGSNVTTSADIARQRSSSLTMPSSQNIVARVDSAAGTVYMSVASLIAVLAWTNVGAGEGQAIFFI